MLTVIKFIGTLVLSAFVLALSAVFFVLIWLLIERWTGD